VQREVTRPVHASGRIKRYGGWIRAESPPPPRPPRELLFEFHVERTHTFYRAELLDRG
jgi:hypothetical protein